MSTAKRSNTKTGKTARKASAEPKADRYAEMTAKIITAIEAGAADPKGWKMPWHRLGGFAPRNIESRKTYQGGNHLFLSMAAASEAKVALFGTYNQWAARHCQVRKGEKGNLVIRWLSLQKRDAEGKPKVTATGRPDMFMTPKVYVVFGIWQVDDAEGHEGAVAKSYKRFGFGPDGEPVDHKPMTEVIAEADAFFTAVGADVCYGGDAAAYSPTLDRILLPDPERFTDAIRFNSTKGHEHIHWTGHADRLARDGITKFDGFGSANYAYEELVAEMGAAFLGQRLGYAVEPRDDHMHYLANWLRALKDDHKLLWKAAREAEAAVAHLVERAGLGEEELPEDDEAGEVTDEVLVSAA